MEKYLLVLQCDENYPHYFIFNSLEDRTKAIELKNIAVEDWDQNCLDAFHSDYEELQGINCMFEYILYKWDDLDYEEITEVEKEWF